MRSMHQPADGTHGIHPRTMRWSVKKTYKIHIALFSNIMKRTKISLAPPLFKVDYWLHRTSTHRWDTIRGPTGTIRCVGSRRIASK